jgi:hypothetical protein
MGAFKALQASVVHGAYLECFTFSCNDGPEDSTCLASEGSVGVAALAYLSGIDPTMSRTAGERHLETVRRFVRRAF